MGGPLFAPKPFFNDPLGDASDVRAAIERLLSGWRACGGRPLVRDASDNHTIAQAVIDSIELEFSRHTIICDQEGAMLFTVKAVVDALKVAPVKLTRQEN